MCGIAGGNGDTLGVRIMSCQIFSSSGSGSDGDDGDGAKIRGGHIGIVMWDDGDRVQTIEGNTQNGVRTRSRLKSSLWGIVNWELVIREEGWE